MPVKKLMDFLNANDVRYVKISHSPAFTAQQIAASAHISGKVLAKTVMVKINGEMAMAVLPASYQVDFDMLKESTGATNVELAREQEFKDVFPESDIGAMPPFGSLYNIPVYVAASMVGDKEIAFNAGSHTELLKMSYQDFERLVNPKVARFALMEAGAHGRTAAREDVMSAMKAAVIFTGTGPILILTTYPSVKEPGFIEKLKAKGIRKFIAREVSLDLVKAKYGAQFDVITNDVKQEDDLRVLDYNGHNVFYNFSFGDMGEPFRYEQ